MQSTENTKNILALLDQTYGSVNTFLDHKTPFQLLIAVILSAQTTDPMVNKVTPELFARYPDAESLMKAKLEDVEYIIKRVNYYKTKAKHIIGAARLIHEDYANEIPQNIADLIKIPGVGRKVANVMMADAFQIPAGIVVDTHVKRVSKRIGWTNHTDPGKIEIDLMRVIPDSHWVNTPKQLILIGRNYCFANKMPDCQNCPLNKWCEKNI